MPKKSSILKFEIISTIFIMIVGTLLHFTFRWSNNNPLVGIFSAVNESVWEHLKLIFFPMLIVGIIDHTLQVTFVVPYFHLYFKCVIFHDYKPINSGTNLGKICDTRYVFF